jgi:hypothetical protein
MYRRCVNVYSQALALGVSGSELLRLVSDSTGGPLFRESEVFLFSELELVSVSVSDSDENS